MTQDERIWQLLHEAAAGDEEGGALFAFYERLLRALAARRRTLSLDGAAVERTGNPAALAGAGDPYLRWEALQLDPATFYPWLQDVAALFEAQDPGALDELEAVEPGESLDLARRWFEEGSSGLGPTVDALLANALAPSLERAAELATPHIPLDLWHRGYCPACGGWPDMARWDEEAMTYTLLCERCRTRWEAGLAGCIFCGESDPELFGYYSSEDDSYRVTVCDSCGHYLKAINAAHDAGDEPLLEAERLLTPGLDLVAIQAGYDRPTLLAT